MFSGSSVQLLPRVATGGKTRILISIMLPVRLEGIPAVPIYSNRMRIFKAANNRLGTDRYRRSQLYSDEITNGQLFNARLRLL